MNKFILLHSASVGDPIVLNANNILVITKSEIFAGCSQIVLNDLDADVAPFNFHTTESPEKIFEMLK